MFNIRATAKLLRRLKCAPAAAGEATTRLGDWYGNLFSVGRQQFAMFTSERSLLTIVLRAKECHPPRAALTDGLRGLLSELAVPRALIDRELNQMQGCMITTTASRSVLGSMKDFTLMAKHYLSESPPLALAEIQRRLAETPMKALDYRYSREVALDLLSGV